MLFHYESVSVGLRVEAFVHVFLGHPFCWWVILIVVSHDLFYMYGIRYSVSPFLSILLTLSPLSWWVYLKICLLLLPFPKNVAFNFVFFLVYVTFIFIQMFVISFVLLTLGLICSSLCSPSPSWITALSWWRAFLHKSVKLQANPCWAMQDRWVIVEGSDKTWSTGEGNDLWPHPELAPPQSTLPGVHNHGGISSKEHRPGNAIVTTLPQSQSAQQPYMFSWTSWHPEWVTDCSCRGSREGSRQWWKWPEDVLELWGLLSFRHQSTRICLPVQQ